MRAIRRFKNVLAHKILTLSYHRRQSCISCVRACVCVSTLWDVGLTSDQAVMSSLFPYSTILMLKLVMNYFLQSFPFLLIERRTVVSHWQNPTPGPFVSIRWELLGVISLPSPPINWEIIQMRTQLSNNIVSSHDHETHVRFKCTNGPTFVAASSVHVFEEVYQRTNFSQITYKASSGM